MPVLVHSEFCPAQWSTTRVPDREAEMPQILWIWFFKSFLHNTAGIFPYWTTSFPIVLLLTLLTKVKKCLIFNCVEDLEVILVSSLAWICQIQVTRASPAVTRLLLDCWQWSPSQVTKDVWQVRSTVPAQPIDRQFFYTVWLVDQQLFILCWGLHCGR